VRVDQKLAANRHIGAGQPYRVSVAQTFILLYRRIVLIVFCGSPASSSAPEGADGMPIANPRYALRLTRTFRAEHSFVTRDEQALAIAELLGFPGFVLCQRGKKLDYSLEAAISPTC